MVTYPSDWSTYSFDQMFQIYPNNTLPRAMLTDKGTVGDIHYGDILIKYGAVLTVTDDIPRIRPEYECIAKTRLQEKDIIVADTAEDETVGKVVQIGKIPFPLAGGLHTIICRPLIPTAPGFLGYYMNSKEYHDQLIPYITGIKVSSISKSSLLEILSGCLTVGAEHALDEQPLQFPVYFPVVRESVRQQNLQTLVLSPDGEICTFNPFERQLILGHLIVLIAKMDIEGLVGFVAPAEEIPPGTPTITQVLIADALQV